MPDFYKDKPIGGFKTIYSYANALVKHGHQVTITYLSDAFPAYKSFLFFIKQSIRYIYHKSIKYFPKKINWFSLDNRVRLIIDKTPIKITFPNADVIVATSSLTAKIVFSLSKSKGEKFYFLQHDESTFSVDHDTISTWGYGFHLMAVAKWIKERVHKYYPETKVDLIPNFVNFGSFKLINKISDRKDVVSMLVHPDPIKGTEYGLKALKIIKKRFPDVKIILFGTCSRPKETGFEFEYYQNASESKLCQIYNESMIYVMPSILEGWGLTATEAMQSGAALVTTENGGVDDFTERNISAIKVPSRSSTSLARGIEKLLLDDDLRQAIAQQGHDKVQRFTFENSYQLFVKSLLCGLGVAHEK